MNPSLATSAWCFSICTSTPPCADASPERPALWQTATGRVPRIGALTAGKTALAVRYGRQATEAQHGRHVQHKRVCKRRFESGRLPCHPFS